MGGSRAALSSLWSADLGGIQAFGGDRRQGADTAAVRHAWHVLGFTQARVLHEPGIVSRYFVHPFWNTVRDRVADKAIEMRRQGFFGAAMLPMAELEYTGITEKLQALDSRFTIRGEAQKLQRRKASGAATG
jgi:hypothetical protein